MKILITGGAGYIGGALTDMLINTKHSVKVYDSLLYEESYRKNVDFIFGDIRDKAKLSKLLKWCDVVVWLAALVGDGACAFNPEIALEVNERSVKWLARVYGGRIIFTSTCSVYGIHDNLVNESSQTNPLSVYASSKFAAEQHLENKNALIFRLGTLFGVGDRFSRIRLDLVVNIMTVSAYRDGLLKVFGGKQYRPLLHVRDAARAIFENLTTSHTGIFNLNRENINILDLAQKIKKHFPEAKIIKEDVRFEDARNYRVENKKAKEILGFQPKLTIDQGIKDMKQLLEEKRILDLNNPRYGNQTFLSKFSILLKKT